LGKALSKIENENKGNGKFAYR